MEFIKRGKGVILLYKGYEYTRQIVYKNNNTLWKCNKRHKTKCKGSITVSPDNTVARTIEHSSQCISDSNQSAIEVTMSRSFDEAAMGKISIPKAFNNGINTLIDQGIPLVGKPLPQYASKKSSMYRRRNKVLNVKKVCYKTVQELQIPLPFEDFVLADYIGSDLRIIIFCREEIRSELKSGNYFIDGTFFACPKPFSQLLSIHADFGSDCNHSKVLPVIYALLSSKSRKAYCILLDLIKKRLPEWTPTKFTVDFERALISALTARFPAAKINGCYFHFVKALTKKAKSLGMNKSIRMNLIIQLTCRLPLLPINKIQDGWNYLIAEMGNSEPENKFKNYMKNYWMKNNFSRVWCVFGERHRTNNAVESWNRKLNRLVPKNVNIVQFLHIIKDGDKLNEYSGTNNSRKLAIGEVEKDEMIFDEQMKLLQGDETPGEFLLKMALMFKLSDRSSKFGY